MDVNVEIKKIICPICGGATKVYNGKNLIRQSNGTTKIDEGKNSICDYCGGKLNI